MKKGIDVSMFAACDIEAKDPDFVIVRSGEGKLKDTRCADYVSTCKALDIPWGLYHVLRLSPVLTWEVNFANIQEWIRKLGKPPMGIWVDVETPDAFDDDAINELCAAIEQLGIYAGVYAGVNQLRTKIYAPKYDKWVAFYGTDSGDINDFSQSDKDLIRSLGTLWQYHGTDGGCDSNVSFLDDLSIYDIPGKQKDQSKEKINKHLADVKTLAENISNTAVNLTQQAMDLFSLIDAIQKEVNKDDA